MTHLHIENYAIIEHLDIDFHAGLNTITGETGAGKSILLGALGLLAGGKGDAAAVGANGENCVVEGVFAIEGCSMESIFEELELDYEPTIEIRRIVSRSGKSRAFVGATPVSVSALRTIVDRLVDIHSQHQTLLLSRGDFQRDIVDAVADNVTSRTVYRATYEALTEARRSLAQLRGSEKDSKEREEFLAFQIDQLKSAKIVSGQQSELEQEQRELSNAEDIGSALNAANEALQNDEIGANVAIKGVIGTLSRIRSSFAAAEPLGERLDSLYIELKDITGEIDSALERVQVNPERLEQVERQLDTIYTLCRKYGVQSGDELLSKLAQFETEYDAIENAGESIEKLEAKVTVLASRAKKEASVLCKTRTDASPKIEKHIIAMLKKLGIKTPRFEVSITEGELSASGADSIKFMFSANDGAVMQPIESAASGGEMSRLMLSIKGLVAQKLSMPTIIFDEIDTGVSGAVADAMGEIIVAMSSAMQVINITHLPQVASKGEHHFQVYKEKGTHIKKLTLEERVEQIASMLSGSTITEAARSQAKTLLGIKN